MKLDEIIDAAAEDGKLTKAQARRFAKNLFDGIRTAATAGEKVSIPGLGSFVLVQRAEGERMGKDGVAKHVAAASYVSFRPTRAATGKAPKRAKTEAEAEA